MSLLTNPKQPNIGVFDSGVGGLSVLKVIRDQVPHAQFNYLADCAHAPYGERSMEHIIDRSLRITEHLKSRGAQTIVVACNTATAHAIDLIRQRHPEIQWVGVEPGIRPAVEMSKSGRIGVLATPATLQSKRFESLLQRFASATQVTPVPCPGLADAIEAGESQLAQTRTLIRQFCKPLGDAGVDTVVLGCTHYPLIADLIAQELPAGTKLLDTAHAIAKRVRHLTGGESTPPNHVIHDATNQVTLESTGEISVLQNMARIHLGVSETVRRVQF